MGQGLMEGHLVGKMLLEGEGRGLQGAEPGEF